MTLIDPRRIRRPLVAAAFATALAASTPVLAQNVEIVTFPGPAGTDITQLDEDDNPILSGVLYTPEGFEELVDADGQLLLGAEPVPAVVLMHGCTGIWSNRDITARNNDLTPNLQNQIEKWALQLRSEGVVALVIDSYTPRRPTTVPAGRTVAEFNAEWQDQCKDRPYGGEVNPYTTRVFDARAGYAFLETFAQVDAGRVGLLGWSQGAQSVLVEMADSFRTETFQARPQSDLLFATGVVYYPGCGTDLGFGSSVSGGFWKPYGDVRMNMGSLDGFNTLCTSRFNRARDLLGDGPDAPLLPYATYQGAKHSFDGVSQTWPTDICEAPATGDVCAMNDSDINSLDFLLDRLF